MNNNDIVDLGSLPGHCDYCKKRCVLPLTRIYRQYRGQFRFMEVCPACSEKHEKELEMTRQSFRNQFGDR